MKGVIILSPGGRHGGGGMGTVTQLISDSLERSYGRDYVHVVDPRGDGNIVYSPIFFTIALFKVVILRMFNRADVLHIQVSERGSFLRKGVFVFLGSCLGMRTILHHHGAELIPFFESAGRLTRFWTKSVVQAADLNIVLGARWKDFVLRNMGVTPNKVVILYNATRDRILDVRPSRTTNVSRPHILLMANLSPRKGVSEFLQAIALFKNEVESFVVTLAGGGDISRYRLEADALGIGDICQFPGWLTRSNAFELLKSADVLVLPSFEEGLPMVIIEALSIGVPVITTPVGSIPEVLHHNISCLFVKPGSVDELLNAIRQLLKDHELARTLSTNGRLTYQRHFNFDRFMETLELGYSNQLGVASWNDESA